MVNGQTPILKSNLVLVVSSQSCQPVKFQINRTKGLQNEQSRNQNILDKCTHETATQTESNFKSSQALVLSFLPIKFQVGQTKHLLVKVWKPRYFRRVHAQNGQMDRPQFRQPWWCLITLFSFQLIGQSIFFELESGNQNVDRGMDSLASRNPPHKGKKLH